MDENKGKNISYTQNQNVTNLILSVYKLKE